MKSINVIDLDKTFIKIDSLKYVLLKNLDIFLIWFLVIRLLHITNRKRFAEKVTKHLSGILHNNRKIGVVVEHLLANVNKEVLDKINYHSNDETTNIILSASPEEYVTKFAEQFGFVGLGSYWDEEKFFHCYGKNKISRIKKEFPKENYNYNLAISDNKDDAELLALFKTSYLI